MYLIFHFLFYLNSHIFNISFMHANFNFYYKYNLNLFYY